MLVALRPYTQNLLCALADFTAPPLLLVLCFSGDCVQPGHHVGG
jgi:hypothetical protein